MNIGLTGAVRSKQTNHRKFSLIVKRWALLMMLQVATFPATAIGSFSDRGSVLLEAKWTPVTCVSADDVSQCGPELMQSIRTKTYMIFDNKLTRKLNNDSLEGKV